LVKSRYFGFAQASQVSKTQREWARNQAVDCQRPVITRQTRHAEVTEHNGVLGPGQTLKHSLGREWNAAVVALRI
jgi:hypothetical protein